MNPWLVIVIAATVLAAGFVLITVRNNKRAGLTRRTGPSAEEIDRARAQGDHALSLLSLPQHVGVRLNVRCGRRMSDPHLAPAAVLHARRQALVEQERISKPQWTALIGPTILVAFFIGPRLLSREDPWLETVFILGLLWLAVWTLTRPLHTLRRFQRAESLNRELL